MTARTKETAAAFPPSARSEQKRSSALIGALCAELGVRVLLNIGENEKKKEKVSETDVVLPRAP
jgi:hypothetical protein